MDLNWCPVCEQHIPLAWESSLYCSDRCKKADAIANPSLGYAFPDDLQTFPRNQQRKSISLSSPLSSPTLTGMGSSSTGLSSSGSAYPSPPTSPMSNYVYNKTSHQNKISPPSFSLGHSAVTGNFNYDLEMRRKSQPYSLATTGTSNNNSKKGFFW